MDDIAKKSSTGLDENVAGMLCYVLGWVTGVVFLIIEKESRFVRFHAMQSIVVFLGITALYWILAFILPLGIEIFLFPILWIGSLILWILLMYKAYKRETFKLPVAGDIAEKSASSI